MKCQVLFSLKKIKQKKKRAKIRMLSAAVVILMLSRLVGRGFTTLDTIIRDENCPLFGGFPLFSLNSVGNPRDQMTKCTEFVTIFSSASSRIFL